MGKDFGVSLGGGGDLCGRSDMGRFDVLGTCGGGAFSLGGGGALYANLASDAGRDRKGAVGTVSGTLNIGVFSVSPGCGVGGASRTPGGQRSPSTTVSSEESRDLDRLRSDLVQLGDDLVRLGDDLVGLEVLGGTGMTSSGSAGSAATFPGVPGYGSSGSSLGLCVTSWSPGLLGGTVMTSSGSSGSAGSAAASA